jgi:2-methylaconitate cis-trans-isomerase PrpF
MDVCWKGGTLNVRKAAILRTARKLFEGVVYFDNLDGCN